MKKLIFTLLLIAGFIYQSDVMAINSTSNTALTMATPGSMTVNDFLAVDLKTYKSADGKKLKWTQRIALSNFQKGLAKKVSKGKIEGTASLNEAAKAPSANKHGLLSLIFSAVGLVLLFTPVGLVGMALGIAGFVLGLIGLKRDADMTMALVGVILGGLVIFITLLAVIVVASWLAW
jgi:hypothetical protein